MEKVSAEGFSLELRDLHGIPALMLVDLNHPEYDPVVVDFLSGQMRHRLRGGLSKTQPLAKALGLKSFRAGRGPRVLDATAGMGTDAFIMAAMGCRLRSVERSEIVFALLEDGYRRLQGSAQFSEVAERLHFENAVSHSVIGALSDADRPDVIYLDPMYPEEGRSRSALPKKEMQIFRRLLGEDHDSQTLLNLALTKARERVVVKRPLYAPPIETSPGTLHDLAHSPTHSFEGKIARFDMYLSPKKI